jgi:hypothetical protein
VAPVAAHERHAENCTEEPKEIVYVFVQAKHEVELELELELDLDLELEPNRIMLPPKCEYECGAIKYEI